LVHRYLATFTSYALEGVHKMHNYGTGSSSIRDLTAYGHITVRFQVWCTGLIPGWLLFSWAWNFIPTSPHLPSCWTRIYSASWVYPGTAEAVILVRVRKKQFPNYCSTYICYPYCPITNTTLGLELHVCHLVGKTWIFTFSSEPYFFFNFLCSKEGIQSYQIFSIVLRAVGLSNHP